MNLRGEESLRIGPAGPSETRGRESAAGLALSAVLHALVLILLLSVGVFGSEGSEGGLEIVPVEVEIAHRSAAAPAQQQVADLPKANVAQPPSAPAPEGVARVTEPSRTDELEAKLEELAKLRQPDAVTPSKENGAARPDRVATGDDIVSGPTGPVQREGLHPRSSRAPLEFRFGGARAPRTFRCRSMSRSPRPGWSARPKSSIPRPRTIRFIARSPSAPAMRCCCRRRFRCRRRLPGRDGHGPVPQSQRCLALIRGDPSPRESQ